MARPSARYPAVVADNAGAGPDAHEVPDAGVPDKATAEPIGRRTTQEFLFGDVTRTTATVSVLVLIVAVITLIVTLSPGETSHPHSAPAWTALAAPEGIDSEADIAQYVLSRAFWTAKPSVYGKSLAIAFRRQIDETGPSHAKATSNGEPKAYSAGELTAEGAHLAGQAIYVVGRLTFRTESPTPAGTWSAGSLTDIELSAPHSDRRVYGLMARPVGAHTGDVVFCSRRRRCRWLWASISYGHLHHRAGRAQRGKSDRPQSEPPQSRRTVPAREEMTPSVQD